jgi:hypothetical protein
MNVINLQFDMTKIVVGENIVLLGSQAQPEHKAHWVRPAGLERFKNFIHLGPPRSSGPNLFS